MTEPDTEYTDTPTVEDINRDDTERFGEIIKSLRAGDTVRVTAQNADGYCEVEVDEWRGLDLPDDNPGTVYIVRSHGGDGAGPKVEMVADYRQQPRHDEIPDVPGTDFATGPATGEWHAVNSLGPITHLERLDQ